MEGIRRSSFIGTHRKSEISSQKKTSNSANQANKIAGKKFKFIASGAVKKVWILKNPPTGKVDTRAFYTPIHWWEKAELKSEYKIMEDIEDTLEKWDASESTQWKKGKRKYDRPWNECLAIKSKKLEKKDRIKGKYTLEVDKAQCDLSKALNENEITLKDGKKHLLTFKDRLNFVKQRFDAAHYLHLAGKFNPDIKDDNVLIYQKGEGENIKLCAADSDFGKVLSQDSQPKKNVKPKKCSQRDFYKGNLRFAPPEGIPSKSGELYSRAILAIRILEEAVLNKDGDPLLTIDKDNRDRFPDKNNKRRGIERFVVNHKAFPAINESSFKDKLFKSIPRRIKLRWNGYKAHKQQQAIHKYIEKLCSNKNFQSFCKQEKIDVIRLRAFLKKLTNAEPKNRGSAEKAKDEFERILNLRTFTKAKTPSKKARFESIGTHRKEHEEQAGSKEEEARNVSKKMQSIIDIVERKSDNSNEIDPIFKKTETDEEMMAKFQEIDNATKEFMDSKLENEK